MRKDGAKLLVQLLSGPISLIALGINIRKSGALSKPLASSEEKTWHILVFAFIKEYSKEKMKPQVKKKNKNFYIRIIFIDTRVQSRMPFVKAFLPNKYQATRIKSSQLAPPVSYPN